ncbi:unnamed protein product [Larinioides sclopetarius]|uniref:Methyltransferase type 11 domain-containing protein n=1 Tax=Larinioides sclopetarius TaxID=280406 RepID=A0AAV1Z5M8_9ARAC
MPGKQYAGEDHAKIYSSYRRDTPTEVIEKIISFLKEKLAQPLDTAVDAGCGNGQGTMLLAPFFKRVHGCDISEAQIKQAKATRSLPNITYVVSPAERLPFEDGSVQLLTAATALHWFDLDIFLPEARRVLCVNGVMAVYLYLSMKPLFGDQQKDAQFDEIFQEYSETEKKYSMKSKVKLLTDEYKDITFPFEEVVR